MDQMLWIRTVTEFSGKKINRFTLEDIKQYADGGHGLIDFNRLLPQPSDFKKDFENRYVSEIASYGDEEAYWRYKTWGCNWMGVDAKWELTSDGFILTFDTVDKCAIGWWEVFCGLMCSKFGLTAAGVYAPDRFGEIEEGSFFHADDLWVHFDITESGFEDNAALIQELWGYRDEDLLDWRGYLHEEPQSEELRKHFADLHFKKKWGVTREEMEQAEMEEAAEEADEETPPPTVRPNLERIKGKALDFLDKWFEGW